MRSKKSVWLVWYLLYLLLRLSGALPFTYNIRRSRFEPSSIALIYSWAVLLAFCAFHPTYVNLYMTRIVTAFQDHIIYRTTDYYFKFGSVAFVLFYLQQIRRRRGLIKFLNDGLEVREQSSDLRVENSSLLTYVSVSFVVFLLFSSMTASNQSYVLDKDEQDELFYMGVITIIPYFTLIFFGFVWVLLQSMVVHVNLRINCKIKWLIGSSNTDPHVLKDLSHLYYKIFDLTRQTSRLSSFIVVVNQVKAFLGIASMLYYIPTYIAKNILTQAPFQLGFFIELISSLMMYSHLITHAAIGFMFTRVSRDTSTLIHELKSNDGRKEVMELALFIVHNRMELRVFDMVTVNLESFFMAVASILAYGVFLVQYGLSTEV